MDTNEVFRTLSIIKNETAMCQLEGIEKMNLQTMKQMVPNNLMQLNKPQQTSETPAC